VQSVSGFMSALRYKLPNCFTIPTKLSLQGPGDQLLPKGFKIFG